MPGHPSRLWTPDPPPPREAEAAAAPALSLPPPSDSVVSVFTRLNEAATRKDVDACHGGGSGERSDSLVYVRSRSGRSWVGGHAATTHGGPSPVPQSLELRDGAPVHVRVLAPDAAVGTRLSPRTSAPAGSFLTAALAPHGGGLEDSSRPRRPYAPGTAWTRARRRRASFPDVRPLQGAPRPHSFMGTWRACPLNPGEPGSPSPLPSHISSAPPCHDTPKRFLQPSAGMLPRPPRVRRSRSGSTSAGLAHDIGRRLASLK